ncbi:unnamed protein product [Brassicogethes aeneus]|uniref:Macro domain-containing protein n=1 Tax=Brassicogethes aeneus TaxID=1431903 RepID=A0A9P0AT48_BRAAE|nr:unnamed protein product [Brassicogethes aeneus]
MGKSKNKNNSNKQAAPVGETNKKIGQGKSTNKQNEITKSVEEIKICENIAQTTQPVEEGQMRDDEENQISKVKTIENKQIAQVNKRLVQNEEKCGIHGLWSYPWLSPVLWTYNIIKNIFKHFTALVEVVFAPYRQNSCIKMGKNKNKSNSKKQQNQAAPVGEKTNKIGQGTSKNKQKSPNTTNESMNISTDVKSEVSLGVEGIKICDNNAQTAKEKSVDRGTMGDMEDIENEEIAQVNEKVVQDEEKCAKSEDTPTQLEKNSIKMDKSKNKSNYNKEQTQAASMGETNKKSAPGKGKNKHGKNEVTKSEKSPNTTNESMEISTDVKGLGVEEIQICENNAQTTKEKSVKGDVKENQISKVKTIENKEIAQVNEKVVQNEEKYVKSKKKPTQLEKNSSKNSENKIPKQSSKIGKQNDIKMQENTPKIPQIDNSKEEIMENNDESWEEQHDIGKFDNLSLKSKEEDKDAQQSTYFSRLNPNASEWPSSPETSYKTEFHKDNKEYKKKSSDDGNWRNKKAGYNQQRSPFESKGKPAWLQEIGLKSENTERIDDEYKEFEGAFNKVKRDLPNYEYKKIVEQQADLFAMGKDYSLAHCVAEDMGMGSGIAVQFRRDFKRVDELLSQKARQGEMALLEVDGRFIYYLVTKRESSGKPTYEKFFSSLKNWRNHVQQHNIKKLAIPRIGCGLDRLEWDKVKFMMEFLFRDVDTEIVVCNFQQAEDSTPPRVSNCKVVNVDYSISAIETGTIILYWASEDGHVTDVIADLDKKFNIRTDYKSARCALGEVIRHDKSRQGYLIYGCVVRKCFKDELDFAALQSCVKNVQKANRKDYYEYVGVQAVKDKDPLMNKKIVNILRNSLTKVDVYVCWPGDLKNDMPPTR